MIRVAYRKSYGDNFDAIFRKSPVMVNPIPLKTEVHVPPEMLHRGGDGAIISCDPPGQSVVEVKAVLDHLIQSV